MTSSPSPGFVCVGAAAVSGQRWNGWFASFDKTSTSALPRRCASQQFNSMPNGTATGGGGRAADEVEAAMQNLSPSDHGDQFNDYRVSCLK